MENPNIFWTSSMNGSFQGPLFLLCSYPCIHTLKSEPSLPHAFAAPFLTLPFPPLTPPLPNASEGRLTSRWPPTLRRHRRKEGTTLKSGIQRPQFPPLRRPILLHATMQPLRALNETYERLLSSLPFHMTITKGGNDVKSSLAVDLNLCAAPVLVSVCGFRFRRRRSKLRLISPISFRSFPRFLPILTWSIMA